MNVKNFLIGSLVASVVYFMLGWVFYGMLFKDLYPASENHNLLFVYLGCLSFSLLLGYIFVRWSGITTLASGAVAGGVVGLLYGLSMNFFMYSNLPADYTKIFTDVIVNGLMGAITGGVLGLLLGKLK